MRQYSTLRGPVCPATGLPHLTEPACSQYFLSCAAASRKAVEMRCTRQLDPSWVVALSPFVPDAAPWRVSGQGLAEFHDAHQLPWHCTGVCSVCEPGVKSPFVHQTDAYESP